jgi:hypothetical protein
MKAYSYNRPLGMGTYPKGYEFAEMVNFEGGKQWVEEVGRDCFGYIEFVGDVPESALESYELVTADMYEASRPKVPPMHVMSKMCYLYKASDFDKLEKMYDAAEREGYDLEATDALLGELVNSH